MRKRDDYWLALIFFIFGLVNGALAYHLFVGRQQPVVIEIKAPSSIHDLQNKVVELIPSTNAFESVAPTHPTPHDTAGSIIAEAPTTQEAAQSIASELAKTLVNEPPKTSFIASDASPETARTEAIWKVYSLPEPSAVAAPAAAPAATPSSPGNLLMPGPAKAGEETTATRFVPITVYYGTDRETTKDKSPWNYYSRGKVTNLSYGTCVVTIPPIHTVGELEHPHWYQGWRKYNSDEDVNLVQIDPCESDSVFVTRLGAGIENTPQKEIFLFIHGFDNTFADAARRTAQLAYDGAKAGYPLGIPVMYSFPSWGTVNPLYYPADENLLDASACHLAQFLLTLHENFPHVPINIVAHSMGNHLFCQALPHYEYLLAKRGESTTNASFSEVAMEAPDEDEQAFLGEASDLFGLSKRVTLYACSHDLGIRISEEINKNPRIGDTGKRVFVLKGMDSVDATAIADWIGHEYYALNPDVPLLFQHWSIPQRKLQEAKQGGYYILLSHSS